MKRAIAGALVGFLAVLALPARHCLGQARRRPTLPPPRKPWSDSRSGVPTGLIRQRFFRTRRVVNDVIGDMEVAVFHDPERGLSAAWFRMVRGEPIEFSGTATGTVADDLTTITRWDLATGVAVGGNLQGQRLVPLAVLKTSWAGWAATHPNAQVFRDGR